MTFFKREKPVITKIIPEKSEHPKKTVYIHDYDPYGSSWVGNRILITLPNNDSFISEFDFFGHSSASSPRPFFDYDYLVFDSLSELSIVQEKELNTAIKNKIPIIILSGPFKGPQFYGHDAPKEFPFFNYINRFYKFQFSTVSGKGRDVNIHNPAFHIWWECVKEYNIVFDQIPDSAINLADNKGNIHIAWSVDNIMFIPGPSYRSLITGLESEKKKEYFSKLIEFALSLHPSKKCPEWVKEYTILDEEELIKNKDRINNTLNELNEIKKIIWTDGTFLQDAFSHILDLLKIKWEKIGTEDFLIKGNPNIVIEITGTRKNLDGQKATQSLQHKEVLRGKIAGNFKSCVIINHQKEKPPIDRCPLDNHTIKEYYEKHDICVISTITLIKYYQKIINKELSSSEFINLLNRTNGELT